MHKLLIIVLTIFSTAQLLSQSTGLIKYKETLKMDLDLALPEGIDLKGLIPESNTTLKELQFNEQEYVYQNSKQNESSDREMESDDGSIKVIFATSSNDEIHYVNLATNILTHQTSFMGKDFIIEKELEKYAWKLTGEKVLYLNYECHKAELTLEAKKEGDKDQHVVAWFTPQIPIQLGPAQFNQLPGAILMLSIDGDRHEIMATEINLESDDSIKINPPSKGKNVTQEEYETIVKEKERELKEMSGNFMKIRR